MIRKISPLLLVISIFFILRIILIFNYPPFNDESSNLYISKIMISNSNARFLSMVVAGKQPLPFWLFGILQMIMPISPFIAGRLVSLFFSIIAAFGIYFLTKDIAGKKAAFISFLAFAMNPMSLFFGIQALMEIMIFAVSAWTLFFLVKYFAHPHLKQAAIIGFLLGIGYWMKSTMVIFIGITYIIFITHIFYQILHRKKNNLSKYLLGLLVLTLTLIIILIPLFTHPTYAAMVKWNQLYGWTIWELLHFPYQYWLGNGLSAIILLPLYLTPFFLIFILFSIKRMISQQYLLLFVWFVFSFMGVIILVKSISSRYLLPTTISLFPLFGIGVVTAIRQYGKNSIAKKFLLLFLAFFPQFLISLVLVLSPPLFFLPFKNIPIVKSEAELISGWVSGYGAYEAINLLEKEGKYGPILVLIRQDSGNPEDAIVTAFWNNSSVRVVKIPQFQGKDKEDFLHKLSSITVPVYFVSRGPQYGGLDDQLKLVARFPKPWGEEFVGVYRLN